MVANASLALLYPTLLSTLSSINYAVFPNDNGEPRLIKLDDEPLSLDQIDALSTNVNSITFSLFTRQNPSHGQELVLNDANSIRRSNWNANRQTVIVTHGWNSRGNKPACTLIRDAFLKVRDVNVVVVDWSVIADDVIYSIVAKSVPSVANHVAAFINFMRSHGGLRPANLKVIGHSLGAHVAGLAARSVGGVAECIGLDPAKPMFENKGAGERIDASDARDVQIVHTCPGLLGLDIPVGTSDFFANGGRKQPGCSNDLVGACAHGRSYHYYSESITNPRGFPGVSRSGRIKAYMGGPTLDANARGSYDFKTASHPPYALGG